MEPSEIEILASRFIAAIQARDLDTVRDIYAHDVEIWHNVTRRTQTREENLALLSNFTSRVNRLRYEEVERNVFERGYAQRHVVRGLLGSGENVDIPAALIVHVSQGRIVRLFEYIDAAAVAPVFA
jgi:ketosteroid isomerase-like protein